MPADTETDFGDSPTTRDLNLFASFLCVTNIDPDIFGLLLQLAYNLDAARGCGYLTICLMESDPLTVAQRYLHTPYRSRMYTVTWDDETVWVGQPDERSLYLEVTAL